MARGRHIVLEKPLARRSLRAAVLIHSKLVAEGSYSPLPVLYDHEWEELTGTIRRLELVRGKGWRAATESLISQLDVDAASLSRQLDRFRNGLPKNPASQQILSPREIGADIVALEQEFEEVELDLKEKKLAVVTSSIELEDIYLGPFRIVLEWGALGSGGCYEVLAEDPHPADSNDDVTHPHVSGSQLCEGEGSTAIHKALAQGRLLDFFVLVRQILETYNPGSAYVALSRWNGGVDCSDCGYSMDEDSSYGCNRCGASVCGDCHNTCAACDEWTCGGCSLSCHECHETCCRGCLKPHPQTRMLTCPTCLQKGEDPDDDEQTPAENSSGEPLAIGKPESPAAEDHSLCLAEAAVPA
jgi:hypothetical protein